MGRRFFREDFDRDRNFIAKRSFVFAGLGYAPGQAVDKTKLTVRRLRQLYDQRYVEYGPDIMPEVMPPPSQPVVVPRRKFSPQTVTRPPSRRRRQVHDGLPA